MTKKSKRNTPVDVADYTADFEKLTKRQKIIKSFKARMDAKRSWIDVVADQLNSWFGTNIFLFLNILWFVVWISINTGLIKGVKQFDPFPYSFLTMTVSLEAIVLSIFVLISQKRSSRIDDLREEIHLQINTIAEEEITKMLQLQTLILKKMNVNISKDTELREMIQPTDQKKIEESIEKQLS